MNMIEAFEHIEWTITRSPQTATMFKERFEFLKTAFEEALKEDENADV